MRKINTIVIDAFFFETTMSIFKKKTVKYKFNFIFKLNNASLTTLYRTIFEFFKANNFNTNHAEMSV